MPIKATPLRYLWFFPTALMRVNFPVRLLSEIKDDVRRLWALVFIHT
jgi:hypothetical protein